MWKPWIPSEVALYASPAELAAIGAGALMGGWAGLAFFIWMWIGRDRPLTMTPVYMIQEVWRDFGPTPGRIRRIASAIAVSVARRRQAKRRALIWATRLVRMPRKGRRLLVAVVGAAIAVMSVGAALYWITLLFNGTIGVSLGSALQVIAMYWGWWRLSVISQQLGRVDILRVIPTALIVILLAGVGAGINYSFAHRPAHYAFEAGAGLESGTYQHVGSHEGFAYLVACGPPVVETLIVVRQEYISSFRPLAAVDVIDRSSVLNTLTGGGPLDVGYRPCDVIPQ
jgi:hypothetical protein